MPISRTRSAQHKVYIPSSARENQYLLANIELPSALLEKYADIIDESSTQPYEVFYKRLADTFFKITQELGIECPQFIANDKFPRVRFSPEKFISQTEQQILFLYNPKYHALQNAFYDGSYRAKKLTLAFLANGDSIREQSVSFHQLVVKAITLFAQQTGIQSNTVRIRDHQHLTYDLFSKDKGIEGTQVHKFRSIQNRYLAENLSLPENTDSLTYAVVDLPINPRIRGLVEIDDNDAERYNPLYNLIADAFISSAKRHNIHNGAIIGNGLTPIVRKSIYESVIANGELQMLGYNPKQTGGGYTCKWSADKLVDTIQLVFVANEHNTSSHGYGKFLNQIEQALRSMADKLEFVHNKEEVIVRFHQHIGFYLD